MYLYSHNENKRRNYGKVLAYTLIIVLLSAIATLNLFDFMRNESKNYWKQIRALSRVEYAFTRSINY